MTVTELREILEELETNGKGNEEVKLAYQPNWPMEVKLDHVYAQQEYQEEFEDEYKSLKGVYLCQSPYGGNDYAPRVVFEDEENFIL